MCVGLLKNWRKYFRVFKILFLFQVVLRGHKKCMKIGAIFYFNLFKKLKIYFNLSNKSK
jgi:hypothetical protein